MSRMQAQRELTRLQRERLESLADDPTYVEARVTGWGPHGPLVRLWEGDDVFELGGDGVLRLVARETETSPST